MTIHSWSKALVVDDSEVYRDVVSTLLRPYSGCVLTARCVDDAIAIVEAHPDLAFVICDVVLGEEDGFAILEHVHRRNARGPRFIMVTAWTHEDGRRRAAELGALACLQKPTRLRQILGALAAAPDAESRDLAPRWRCAGRARLVTADDDTLGCLVWDVYDIGPTGAFLETKGPLPVGAVLKLVLEIGERRFTLRARVARTQEPSWMDVAGVGVEFIGLDDELRAELERAVHGGSPASEPSAAPSRTRRPIRRRA
jgi:CheY-like chemotaxis protein